MIVHYKSIVNASADADNATTTGHMRVFTAIGPAARAALDPVACAAALAADASDGVDEVVREELVAASVFPTCDEIKPEEVPAPAPEAPEALVVITALAAEPDAEAHEGAAVAAAALSRVPVPKDTVDPSNSSLCVGSVLVPSAAAMVNRPVQVVLAAEQDVNW